MVYLNLLWAYLKIGLFGFGGGYAMLSFNTTRSCRSNSLW